MEKNNVEIAAEEWRKVNCPNAPYVIDAFIAGSEWKEQLIKEQDEVFANAVLNNINKELENEHV